MEDIQERRINYRFNLKPNRKEVENKGDGDTHCSL